MRRSHSGLPRSRLSFPGGPAKFTSRPGPWAALLLFCGVLLLTGYARIAGRIRLGELKDSSNNKSSSNNSNSNGQLFAVSALHITSSSSSMRPGSGTAAAGAGKPPPDVSTMQSMQQGMDFAADSTMRMLSARQQPVSYSSSGMSFLVAQPAIKDAADAVSRRPAVHGWVQKAGLADPRTWLANHTDDRLDNFMSWRLNRVRAGGPGKANETSYTCPAADHPPLPFPGCHVFVNHQYKYIYIRTPKAASTSIVDVLGECDNVRTRGFNSSSCMALHFYWPKSLLELDSLQQMWKDYFVFGFVRNPWRRAYSLYKYLHSNGCMDNASLKNPECRVSWARFCLDPWSAAEELHDKGCIKRSKSYLYFHMTDQYHCLTTAEGSWAVDYIGRVDEPNEDWAEVIKALNTRRQPGMPELPVNELEQKNVRKGSNQDPYSADQLQCFDSVSRWYACDIDRFGFAAAKPA